MADKTLVLVCNSHVDPVWLWPWEEGLAVTLSTFRAAADLCEEFDGFVFCHNEALLYDWVEQYEPALFARIQRLVREDRWHVMGGWYLQPDCNLPCGESLVRQILVGKRYFMEKFGVEPRVAVNVDPFGHTRGLPQILAKTGYEGYLFCRPDRAWLELPSDDFVWVGYDGSTVLAHRASEHYNSELGKARAKVEGWLEAHQDQSRGLLLWGVGNHGGGPSRQDLRALAEMITPGVISEGERDGNHAGSDFRVVHGRPEDYFAPLREDEGLPRWERDLNPWAVGCYTSMATVKRAHAGLERGLFLAESMLANAAAQGLLPYPRAELRAALEDLLYCQFHDVLPGEGVREVEQQALGRLGHGQEIVGRLRARAFFAFLNGEPAAADSEFPLFVHNHHPFPVTHIVSCEFQPPEPNFNREVFWQPRLTDAQGRDVSLQLEKESCNIQNDQRKRVVFRATLPPSSTSRFSCRLEELPRLTRGDTSLFETKKGKRHLFIDGGRSSSDGSGPAAHVSISSSTGLLTRFAVDGVDYLAGPAFRPLLMKDSADPWGMKTRAFRDVVGEFTLMSPARAAAFAGVSATELAPVRIIEDGPVRTTIEALLECNRSALAIRYTIPTVGTGIEVELRAAWFERDRLLKLSVPTTLGDGEVRVQTAYGVEVVRARGEETVGQRWLAILSPDGGRALTLVNDTTYGFDVAGGDIRLSLLRAPAYAGHPVDAVTPIVRQDRFEPREDQGEHVFRFWLDAGPARERLEAIDREAAIHTEGLMALCAFPSGEGAPALQGVHLEGEAVRLGALKMSEDGHALVLRLFEPTGKPRDTRVRIPALGVDFPVALRPFELRTLLVDLATRTVTRADLLERAEVAP